MALMRRGKLFAGALFAGVLFGPGAREAARHGGRTRHRAELPAYRPPIPLIHPLLIEEDDALLLAVLL